MQDIVPLSQRVWTLSTDFASLLINRTSLVAVEECLINSCEEAVTLINSLHRPPRTLGIARMYFDALNLSHLYALALALQTMLAY